MADPITLKGIQRNASKLAVEDGRAEDLINLRFKDGSWRTAGDGKQVFAMTNETTGVVYEQLYIHTNASYHHILGVNPADSKLYWFANIEDNGETFTALDTPQEICRVSGDLFISQTGHLITIISNEEKFSYFLFKREERQYVEKNVNIFNDSSARDLYPFGRVNFNINEVTPTDAEDRHFIQRSQVNVNWTDIANNTTAIFGESIKRNLFTRPFLACAAARMYDGSFVFASQPVLLWPRQKVSSQDVYYKCIQRDRPPLDVDPEDRDLGEERVSVNVDGYDPTDSTESDYTCVGYTGHTDMGDDDPNVLLRGRRYFVVHHEKGSNAYNVYPTQANHLPTYMVFRPEDSFEIDYYCRFMLFGSDLTISLGNYDFLKDNEDIFKSLCIFVSPQIDFCVYDKTEISQVVNLWTGGYPRRIFNTRVYLFPRKKYADLIDEISKSQLFLLREYDIHEIESLKENPIIDLSGYEYKDALSNLVERETLTIEAVSRSTYLPKVQYTYNGKLHIANYIVNNFHGYNLESLQMNNNAVNYEQGGWYPNTTDKKVLPNLKKAESDVLASTRTWAHEIVNSQTQWEKDYIPLLPNGLPIDHELINKKSPVFWAETSILTDEGIKKVVRRIDAYDTSSQEDGIQNFIESLDALVSYPDTRAIRFKIYRVVNRAIDAIGDGSYSVLYKEYDFDKYKMEYINYSVLFEKSLKPFSLIEGWEYISGRNNDGITKPLAFTPDSLKSLTIETTWEHYPNGLKVSKTNNPLVLPVENTYQVGEGTILALCSNAIAVGTGQTGEAPLYVFCTDGIYALYVDASGEMAYTNARVIARDVCNNAKSVTPTDQGVVFTTDRGLMEIAGDVVNEIGQPAEGDVVKYTEPNWAKPNNVGKNMLTKVAELPLNLVDGVDFLSYLTGAIVNYNHNERELMISNPAYPYTYVLDRYNNWSRRDYTADEYVNNFPTSYRVKDGVFYKVDAEQDGLEGKSEAPNKFLYLSNVLKLGSVDFKQAYRFVVRGKFNTREYAGESFYTPTSSVILYDKTQEDNIIKHFANNKEYKISPKYDDANLYTYTLRIFDTEGHQISAQNTVNGVVTFIVEDWNNVGTISLVKQEVAYPTHEHLIEVTDAHILGCYVFGSYDGNQFALLGANEKKGQFTDIGCKIERTDVKYFRIGLAGHLSGDSRIDFMEIEGAQSNLTTKLR